MYDKLIYIILCLTCVDTLPMEKNTRGPTRCSNIWNMPEGQKITVTVNKNDQSIGSNGKKLAKFLGTLERNNTLTQLNYNDWRLISND